MNLYIKESFFTILTQVIQMLGGLLVFKLLTSKLDNSDFGFYALILSFSAVIFSFPFTAIQQSIVKYTSVISENKAINIYKTIFILDIFIFMVYIFISLCLIFFNLININLISYIMVTLYIITEVLKINNYMYINSLRKRKKYFYAVLIEFFIKLSLLYFVMNSIKEVFFIFILANIFSIIYSKPNNLNLNFPNKIQFFYWLKMIYIFASPLAIWAIFGWMRDMSNRWIIEYYLTLDYVALFSVINSLIVIVPGALQSFFAMYFIPILYRKEKEDRGYIRRLNKKIIYICFFIIILGTLIIELMSKSLIIILSDIKYIDGAWTMAPMFFSFCLFSLSMLTTTEIFAYNKTKLLLSPNIISGIVSVISFVVLVDLYDIKGAVYAFMISYLSYSILTFYITYKFKV